MQETINLPRRFWEDDKWAHQHYMELQDKYIDKWVAICNKKVVAVADGPETVRESATKITGIKEIVVIFVESGNCIYHIPNSDEIVINT